MNGVKAFRAAFLHADTLDPDSDFLTPEARALRYEIMWGFFQNDVYSKVNAWSKKLKADYGLYKYTRSIYSPAFRLASFWQTHLMGGLLALDADGAATNKGALPIVTDNTALLKSIGQLWRDSNWQLNKDIFTLWGTVLGDAALRVIDDPRRERVFLQRVHPGTLASVTLDPYGNVKAYTIKEKRAHPEKPETTVVYTEQASRDGDDVVFETFMDGAPYDWRDKETKAEAADGDVTKWSEPYGFIPLVLSQHFNVGLPWGWAELHPALSKVRELDDAASALGDHLRKQSNPIWLFAGMTQPKTPPVIASPTPTTGRPEPEREDTKALYAPDAGAKPHPLVTDLSVEAALKHIASLIAETERDFPELRFEAMRMGGNVSGETLRTAQEPVEDKVGQRRPNYDDALRRAQAMAVAIGGFRGYKGYEGFTLDSFKAGNLEHHIGARPVFGVSVDEQLKRATTKRGLLVPVPTLWSEIGYPQDEIAKMESGAEYQAYLQGLGMGLTANG